MLQTMQAMPTNNAALTDLSRNNSTVVWNNTKDDDVNVGVNDNGLIAGLVASQGLLASIRLSMYSIVAITFLLGNILTLLAVATTDRLRVKTYALITSLAFADLLMGVTLVIYVIHEGLSKTTCDLATYKSAVRPFERFAIYVSFLHIAAIAIDRFVAVVHPLHYENRMTPSTIRNIVIIIWSVAATCSMPPYFGFLPSIKPQSCILTLWPVFETVVEVMIYSMNTIVVVVVYVRIWSTAMRHKDQHEHFNAQPQQQQQQQQRHDGTVGGAVVGNNSLTVNVVETQNVADMWWRLRNLIWKHRATKTVTAMLIMYVVLLFPYVLSRLLGVVSSLPVTNMQMIGSIIGMANMSMNVFVYGIMNKEFRLAYKRVLRIGTNVIHHPQG